jgi:hypothetical protein
MNKLRSSLLLLGSLITVMGPILTGTISAAVVHDVQSWKAHRKNYVTRKAAQRAAFDAAVVGR